MLPIDRLHLMAQRVEIVLEDDIDGSAADETVEFRLDGAGWEIDLTSDHATQLRGALSGWVGAARRVGGTGRRGNVSQPTAEASNRKPARTDPSQPAAIRARAGENGYQVSPRGRVPSAV